ncbi:hypothetical protein VB716_08195 [Synechococcus sp. CCY9201]|nr:MULTISPECIES: hypothetical protein [unclassified Synechococcus]MEA5474200.1 hypothetical protein [Synechococcus sp. CCY9201]CAK6693161.1 hypothetical protein IFHNHDMJ_01367 [Synechococcus sp. CBW1107]
MRQHPISPVTEPLQYRAIGVVRGVYQPEDPEQLTRGRLLTDDGGELEAVVLGRLLTLMRRHLDLAEPHLWVVYPRTRDEGTLHLQLVGVWEPSTLDSEAHSADEPLSDSLPEGDDYFSIRGELIFTKPESNDLVVKVRVLPKPDGSRPTPFKVQLKGDVPLQHLRHFVSLDGRRRGQELHVEQIEVIGPVNQRGNRGGKGRRGGGAGSGERGRKDAARKEPARNETGRGGPMLPVVPTPGESSSGGLHRAAISRPSR